MQFNYNATKDSLYDDIDYLCGSTSATYPILDKRRNIYNAYNDVSHLIWEVAYGWQYDDSNQTTLPVAQATLVHNQQDYTVPSVSQRIERIEIKDSNGDWVKLEAKDTRDINVAIDEYVSSPGLPAEYDLIGNSISLYPAPSSAYCTMTSGMQLILSRDVSAFASGSSAEPGFARPFHRILSLSASIDFTEDPQRLKKLLLMKDRLEKGLTRFYSKRMEEYKTTITPHGKNRWRRYL